MLELISPTSGSPTARLLRLLDKEIDDLMDPEANKLAKAVSRERAKAFTQALQVVTCASEEEIKNVAMLRYEERSEE